MVFQSTFSILGLKLASLQLEQEQQKANLTDPLMMNYALQLRNGDFHDLQAGSSKESNIGTTTFSRGLNLHLEQCIIALLSMTAMIVYSSGIGERNCGFCMEYFFFIQRSKLSL